MTLGVLGIDEAEPGVVGPSLEEKGLESRDQTHSGDGPRLTDSNTSVSSVLGRILFDASIHWD